MTSNPPWVTLITPVSPLCLLYDVFPQDRVIINRLDSICQAVLKGKWPTPRKTYDGVRVVTFYTNQLLDSPGAATTEYSEASSQPSTCVAVKSEPCQSAQMSKVKKHVPEKEFTVKINDVCVFCFLALGPGCRVSACSFSNWLPALSLLFNSSHFFGVDLAFLVPILSSLRLDLQNINLIRDFTTCQPFWICCPFYASTRCSLLHCL